MASSPSRQRQADLLQHQVVGQVVAVHVVVDRRGLLPVARFEEQGEDAGEDDQQDLDVVVVELQDHADHLLQNVHVGLVVPPDVVDVQREVVVLLVQDRVEDLGNALEIVVEGALVHVQGLGDVPHGGVLAAADEDLLGRGQDGRSLLLETLSAWWWPLMDSLS